MTDRMKVELTRDIYRSGNSYGVQEAWEDWKRRIEKQINTLSEQEKKAVIVRVTEEEFIITYKRLETDEEYDQRISKIQNAKDVREQQERQLYHKLKAKYESN